MHKFSTLKIVSFLIGGVGLIVSSELQRRENEAYIDKALAEREAPKTAPSE